MDMSHSHSQSHHKFTSWETYNVAAAMAEEHGHLHQLDHDYQPTSSDWPYHLPLHAAADSPPAHLLAAAEQAAASFKCECDGEDDPEEELGAMKEMMFKIAAMQPVDIDPTTIRKPRRRNVRISEDPQSVAARHRRERISEKIRILQRLVPGGTKMDTASMLDEAIRYVKFLKRQIRILNGGGGGGVGTPNAATAATASYLFGGNNEDGAAGDDRACFNNYI